MRNWLITFLTATVITTATVARAQDNCTVTHPALTGLDHASMLAAYTASYQGLYGHPPSMKPGSGAEDGEYWISISNHYGMFSDGVCRAGWNRYWEGKIAGQDALNPALGDQPARYQPGGVAPAPTPTPTPTPAPVPPPVDLGPLEARLAAAEARIDALVQIANSQADAVERSTRADTIFSQQIDAITNRLNALESRPIIKGCSASISGIPIHCAVK